MTIINTTAYPSKNYNERPGAITAIVFHTGEGTKQSDLATLTNDRVPEKDRVSANYYVDRLGNIYLLVPDHKRAWHAGVSSYLGLTDWNDFAIGVETEHKKGQSWPQIQVDAIAGLFRSLISQYNIKENMIVAHRWIAYPHKPQRKFDPTDWTDEELKVWIHGLYVQPEHSLPGLNGPMACGLGFYNFYQTTGGMNLYGYALTEERSDIDNLGRQCTWMRFERAVFKYVYGEGVHLALLVEAAAKKWLL